MGIRIEVDAGAFTGSFIHVFPFELNSVFSMPYLEVLASESCAHRARDRTIMSGFALDVEGDAVGSFRLDFEVCWRRGLDWPPECSGTGENTGLDMVEIFGQELSTCEHEDSQWRKRSEALGGLRRWLASRCR